MKKWFLLGALCGALGVSAWQENYAPKFNRVSVPLVEEDDRILPQLIDLQRYAAFTGKYIYSADLNMDGKKDFVVYAWTGGCGLAMCRCDVFFFLSSPQGYYKTSFNAYSFEEKDIIRHGNKNYFLLTLCQSWSTENGHNYWLNRIYAFGKDGKMYEADSEVGAPFPSYIQYLERDNHEQAKLSPVEKEKMWQAAKERLFDKETQSQLE